MTEFAYLFFMDAHTFVMTVILATLGYACYRVIDWCRRQFERS